MGRSRGRRGRREPGWILSVLGASVTVFGGFFLGLILGVVSDEPELLLGHLAGRSQAVPWTRVAEVDPVPVPSGGENSGASDRRSAGEGPSASQPAVSAPAPGQRFSVQVGAFRESAPAEELAQSLRRKDFPVYVTPGPGSPDGRWRVRVGPLRTRLEADTIAKQLKLEERLPTWVRSQ